MKGSDVIESLGLVEEKYVEEAGREDIPRRKSSRRTWKRNASAAAAACAALLLLGSATSLAMDSFSDLKGDWLAFEKVEYLGDGMVAVQVRNESNKILVFQEDVKLCTFYGNQEIPQLEGGKVRMQGNVVKAHSSSEVLIDLSEAYDMAIADQPLENEKDWYFLVLTNDHFVFGQDWHCSIDFQNTPREKEVLPEVNDEPMKWEEISQEDFRYGNWVSPTEKLSISTYFGPQRNGSYSDHINIAGSTGDRVFAVDDGTILDTGFEKEQGNYVVLQLADGAKVKFGHLKEVSVVSGQQLKSGEVIGTVGKTGMAAGPNLSLTLYVDDEAVDPLKAE